MIDEIRRVNQMKFDYLQKSQGMSYCSRLAKLMHKRKIEELIVYPYLMEEFQPNQIDAYLGQLNNSNLTVMLEAKSLEPDCSEIEPIYSSKFSISPLSALSPLQCQVDLP